MSLLTKLNIIILLPYFRCTISGHVKPKDFTEDIVYT